MMNKRERALPTSDQISAPCAHLAHMYYITLFSGLTSIIACANITGLWSGIVAMVSVGVTLAMLAHTTGGFMSEED